MIVGTAAGVCGVGGYAVVRGGPADVEVQNLRSTPVEGTIEVLGVEDGSSLFEGTFSLRSASDGAPPDRTYNAVENGRTAEVHVDVDGGPSATEQYRFREAFVAEIQIRSDGISMSGATA